MNGGYRGTEDRRSSEVGDATQLNLTVRVRYSSRQLSHSSHICASGFSKNVSDRNVIDLARVDASLAH